MNDHDEPLAARRDLALRGQHNLYNSLAAAVSARVMEVTSDVIRNSLSTFEGVPHRLETVRTVGDVLEMVLGAAAAKQAGTSSRSRSGKAAHG